MSMNLDELLTWDCHKFLTSGGMTAREREAALPVILEEREFWLPILEGWLEDARADGNLLLAGIIFKQIKRARRGLNLPPRLTPDIKRRREQTRERVRRYRERQKA